MARNAGPDTATGVVVADALPSQLGLRSASATQGACTTGANAVNCAVGTLAAGQTVTVTVRATALRSGSVTNTARVSAPPGGPPEDPSDNTATAALRIVKPALRITKGVSKATLRAGETATYTIRVRNPSALALRNVRTCDTLPAGLKTNRATATSPDARTARATRRVRVVGPRLLPGGVTG